MEEEIKKVLEKILNFFEINDFSLDFDKEDDAVRVNLRLENAGFLIGADGEHLRDLEHILRAMLQRQNYEKRIVLDINNYRRGREEFLKEIAKETAHKVKLTKKPVKLPAMNAYERRIIHMELATHPDVATESVGVEPERYLVVKPYP